MSSFKFICNSTCVDGKTECCYWSVVFTEYTQVELNTIASSFGCLSTLVGRLHRYVKERASVDPKV